MIWDYYIDFKIWCLFLFVVIKIWSFPHLWLITRFVTRLTWRVPHLEQELIYLPEQLSSPLVFSGVLVCLICVVLYRSLFVNLTIVLSLLQFTASEDTFGIFSLFLFFKNKCFDDVLVHTNQFSCHLNGDQFGMFMSNFFTMKLF